MTNPNNGLGGRRPLPPTHALGDSAQHAMLRSRTPEDDVPPGVEWTPTERDHISRRELEQKQIPDFIPLNLRNVTGTQKEFAASVIADQIADGSRRADDIPSMPAHAPAHAPDFDPEVDEEDDVYSPANITPQNGSQVDTLRESVLRKQRERGDAPTGSNAAPRQQQNANQQKPEQRPGLMQEHPVLAKLRSRYGIAALDIRKKEIDGFTYGFRKHSNQAYLKFVTNMVMPTIETTEELRNKHGYALAAISIVSIDDTPAWEVMGIDIDDIAEAPLLRERPLDPPTTVVIKTAEALYTWFISLGIPEFGDTLAKVYIELFPDIDLTGNLDLWLYKCPNIGCQERLERVPEYNADGTQVPRYCPTHGVAMIAIGSKRELGDIPLA